MIVHLHYLEKVAEVAALKNPDVVDVVMWQTGQVVVKKKKNVSSCFIGSHHTFKWF